MSYELIWEPAGVVKRYRGVLTGHDLVESVERTEADPRFDGLRYVINDFLAVVRVEVILADVEHVAAVDRGAAMTNRDIWIAVLTTSGEITGLARRYAELSRNVYPTQVFETMSQARLWLADR